VPVAADSVPVGASTSRNVVRPSVPAPSSTRLAAPPSVLVTSSPLSKGMMMDVKPAGAACAPAGVSSGRRVEKKKWEKPTGEGKDGGRQGNEGEGAGEHG
jgi:hypothetical protein